MRETANMPPRRPAVFDAGSASVADAEVEDVLIALQDASAAVPAPVEPKPQRRTRLARLFWSALGILVSLAVGLAVTDLVEALWARADWLGWAALTAAGVAGLTLLVLLMRELLAIRRLAAMEDLRVMAGEVLASNARADGVAVVERLIALYASVPETAAGRARLKQDLAGIFDGAEMVRLAERDLLAPLDAAAARAIAQAAQRVSIVTAVVPRAAIDIAVVASVSVSLIRRIATIYGARPGRLGFFRLVRHVLGHLAVTGGMAAGDSLLEQVVGHGLAARLSARLGEGVINGILTARVGLAAMAVCRPLPFEAVRAPNVRDVAGSLFQGNKKTP